MSLPEDREEWKTRNQFTFTLITLVLGASNVCRFPYLVYENGGLIFVVVYAFLVAAVGMPMLYLEVFLGQFSGWSVPKSFGGFPMAKGEAMWPVKTPNGTATGAGIGWTMAYVAVLSSIRNTPIVAYTLIYLTECFLYELPWNSCPVSGVAVHHTTTNTSSPSSPSGTLSTDDSCYEMRPGLYPCVRLNATLARRYSLANYTGEGALAVQTDGGKAVAVPMTEYEALRHNCTNGTLSSQEYHFRKEVLRLSSSIDEAGTLQAGVAVAMILCGFFVFLAISKSLQSLGKLSMGIVYSSALLMCVLCAAAIGQDGASLGLWAGFKLDPWKLFDVKTWHSASRQMFYSLSLSIGAVTCFASYSDFQANVFNNAVKASLADFGYSMLATVFVFCLYGSLARSSHMEIGDVVTYGLDFAFVGFPEAISSRSNQRLWCFTFYLALLILNVGSQACVVEGYLGSLKDIYPWLRQRSLLAALLGSAGCTMFAMPMALQAGLYILELMESIVYGDLLPWVGLAELTAVAHGYGCERFVHDITFTFESPPRRFLPICWRYLCPTVLGVIALSSFTLTERRQSRYQNMFPAWTGLCQLLIFGVVVVLIATFVISTLERNKYDLYSALEPEATYGPRGRAEFMRYQMYLSERNALPCSMPLDSRRDVIDMPGASPGSSANARRHSSRTGGGVASPAMSDKPKLVVVSTTGLIEGSANSALGSGYILMTQPSGSTRSRDKNQARK